MSFTDTLPDRQFRPLVSPFESYHRVHSNVPDEPDFGLTSKTRMVRLPAVPMATLRYLAAPAASMHPTTRGVVTEASMRLAVWKDRGARLSGWEVAKEFQTLYFPTGLNNFRRNGDHRRRVPLKGLDLIRATDELGCEGLEWWCDMPYPNDEYRFHTVRLKDALACLG